MRRGPISTPLDFSLNGFSIHIHIYRIKNFLNLEEFHKKKYVMYIENST